MKNYLLSFLYCFISLAIFGLGFWGLSVVLDIKTYQTVITTVSLLCLVLSFFLCVWFGQDELFFLLFLNLLVYLLLGHFRPSILNVTSYSHLVAFPILCWILPFNVYLLLKYTSNGSFVYPLSQKLIILFSELFLVYFSTYLIPLLLGRPVLENLKRQIGAALYFPFDADYYFPAGSIFPFILFLILMISQKTKRNPQVQSALITLFFVMFLSLLCVIPLFSLNCALSAVLLALCLFCCKFHIKWRFWTN